MKGDPGELAFEEVADFTAVVDPVGDVVEVELSDLDVGQGDGGGRDGELGELGGELRVQGEFD